MRIDTIFLFLISIFIITSCAKDNSTITPLEPNLEELWLEQDIDLESRNTSCNLQPTIDENGCCVYILPFRPGFFYRVDGMRVANAIITVCEGERVVIYTVEVVPENPSGIRVECQQVLTCSCCNLVEYEVSYHIEQPNCCRIELDFNRPQCVDNTMEGVLVPSGLNNDFSVTTLVQNEQGTEIRICGSGDYPSGARLFVQIKLDNQCKSKPASLPLYSCF